MRNWNLKKFLIAGGLLGAFMGACAADGNAQTWRDRERERERIERMNERLERRRQREQRRVNRDYYGYPDQRPMAVGRAGSSNSVFQQGYQQGFLAGISDGRARKYNRFNVYRNTGSYPNGGDPTSHDYVYRQGYLEGYEDGYRGRRRY